MHSDQAKLSATPSGAHEDGQRDGLDPVLARRRLLLRGLGKGAAAAAALAPLAGHATRTHVLPNPNLGTTPGGVTQNGYCSVSGFQSAAISVAPGRSVTTCSATPPDRFYGLIDQAYSWAARTKDKDNLNARRMSVRLFFQTAFGFTAAEANNISNTAINKLATLNSPVVIAGGGRAAIYWGIAFSNPAQDNQTGTGTIRQLKATELYPSAVATALPLRSFENMMDNTGTADATNPVDSVLYTLFNGQTNNKAYFAAVALSCIIEDRAFRHDSNFDKGLLPFDAKYVGDLYNNDSKRVAAGRFFKAVCGR